MRDKVSKPSTLDKALRINLDEKKYGSIAEIGAGQEVARQFFLAGAAAGTIAKTMSAYDMQFSDAIYGVQQGGRYVSEARVKAMLGTEYDLVVERVSESRPRSSRFFAYAATVSAKSFNRDNECHAWCGVRVQMYPGAAPSDIIVHVRMRDGEAEEQQDALGILGVNLIHGAYYHFEDAKKLVDSLTDNVAQDRIEIDSIELTGPYFEDLDQCAINLHLIRSWKTRAVMFHPDGTVGVPSEMLYKKNVLTIRGSFKPVTRLNVDMIEQGLKTFAKKGDVELDSVLVLAEISLNDHLGNDLNVPEEDLVVRITLLNALGYHVMVSDYTRYFSLRAYFRQYTNRQIGIVLGMINMRQIFDADRYEGVEGGILEGFGKLFPDNTRLYVYPELNEAGDICDVSTLEFDDRLQHLYEHLIANGYVRDIEAGDPELLHVYSRDVLQAIAEGGEWEATVPDTVAKLITERGLLGYKAR